MFYIAADRILPAVHKNERYPDLTVSDVGKDAADTIRSVIDASHIYNAGSWQECGCGFCYEDPDELEAILAEIPDEAVRTVSRTSQQAGYNSVASLRRYLANAVVDGPLRLYVAWAGDEGNPVTTEVTIMPDYFGGHWFGVMDVDTLLTVVSGEPARV